MPPIKSVLELSRYKVGESVWWVTLRPVGATNVMVPSGDEWMLEHHPKVLYDRGIAKNVWNSRAHLPKLNHVDFQAMVMFLTSKLEVEQFKIYDIARSEDTGEFFYITSEEEWMPESYLFDSSTAAKKERNRILRMIKKWADK
jgi:hypothetical protein